MEGLFTVKLTLTTCYSHLLYFMSLGEAVQDCVYKIECSSPDFQHEGVAGYIETVVTIHIKDLSKFSILWDKWHDLPPEERTRLYSIIRRGFRHG